MINIKFGVHTKLIMAYLNRARNLYIGCSLIQLFMRIVKCMREISDLHKSWCIYLVWLVWLI